MGNYLDNNFLASIRRWQAVKVMRRVVRMMIGAR